MVFFFTRHPSFKVKKAAIWNRLCVSLLFIYITNYITFIVPGCDYDRTKCNVQYVHVFLSIHISDTGRRKYLNSSRNSVDIR